MIFKLFKANLRPGSKSVSSFNYFIIMKATFTLICICFIIGFTMHVQEV